MEEVYIKCRADKIIPEVREALGKRERLTFWEIQAIATMDHVAAVIEKMTEAGELIRRGEYYHHPSWKPKRRTFGGLLRCVETNRGQ